MILGEIIIGGLIMGSICLVACGTWIVIDVIDVINYIKRTDDKRKDKKPPKKKTYIEDL